MVSFEAMPPGKGPNAPVLLIGRSDGTLLVVTASGQARHGMPTPRYPPPPTTQRPTPNTHRPPPTTTHQPYVPLPTTHPRAPPRAQAHSAVQTGIEGMRAVVRSGSTIALLSSDRIGLIDLSRRLPARECNRRRLLNIRTLRSHCSAPVAHYAYTACSDKCY